MAVQDQADAPVEHMVFRKERARGVQRVLLDVKGENAPRRPHGLAQGERVVAVAGGGVHGRVPRPQEPLQQVAGEVARVPKEQHRGPPPRQGA